MAKPATRKEFAAWCQASIAYMETNLPADIDGELDDSFHRFAAKLVRLASGHAVRLRLIRLASDLPWVDTKNAKDCICRLHECLRVARRRRKAKGLLTPPQVAKRLRVSPKKVREWIETGKLPATNFADPTKSRPRYRIEAEALEEFRKRRNAKVVPPTPRQVRRRKQPTLVTRY